MGLPDIVIEFTKKAIATISVGTGGLVGIIVKDAKSIKIAQMIKDKKDIRFTVISKLADPDSFGAERVSLTGVSFDDLTLFDWEAQKPGETECPFTFTGYEYLDQIKPQ